MLNNDQTVIKDIVLVGGGHSHAVVLRDFGMAPVPGVRLTVICTDTHTPYSGMLPGYVAGHYDHETVHIDLRRLAQFAGARFYRDEVVGLDRVARKVLCRNRPPVAYDLLSINTGSTPQMGGVPGAAQHAIAVKPIAQFNARWLALLERVHRSSGPINVAVVGAGAGGVELLLAMQFRLRQALRDAGHDPSALTFHLFTSAETILPTHNARVRRAFDAVLARRGVQVHRHAGVTQVEPGLLQTSQGQVFAADEILWVTHAGGPAWLKTTGLALCKDGFIAVKDTLQTLDDPNIFAAGDVASIVGYPLEKAGVFAVRQGRPLAQNLRLRLLGATPKPYHPQHRWLALISTGDRYAVASRGSLGLSGAWVWRWKDWIDRRFVRQFHELPREAPGANMAPPAPSTPAHGVSITPQETLELAAVHAMRCGGCGAKVGPDVLSRALAQVHPIQRAEVLIGLNDPDDAAVVRVPAGKAMVHTVDFFRAFVDDPYVFGKVAANHALGDIWAMGAQAQTATAIVTVPAGLDSKVQELLLQLMTGATQVLNEAQCALVGGHTAEGRELALGFAINGLIDDSSDRALRKAGMRAGDVLILTKPLGTGTLFAAHAGLVAKGRWIDAALESMLVSNQSGAQCLRDHGATACTDVSGFGLLGHLLEMTRPSGVDAEIQLDMLPLLDGAITCVHAGIVSSLQSANRRLASVVRDDQAYVGHPSYPLLFDPQTAGGLLASVPYNNAPACIAALHSLGYSAATAIGRAKPPTGALASISLVGAQRSKPTPITPPTSL
jgi:selenide,water dikinase